MAIESSRSISRADSDDYRRYAAVRPIGYTLMCRVETGNFLITEKRYRDTYKIVTLGVWALLNSQYDTKPLFWERGVQPLRWASDDRGFSGGST